MKTKYKRISLLLGLLLNFQNVFAQCTEQKNFDITWNINGYNIAYDIKRKNGAEFFYYNNPSASFPVYKGIKLDHSIKIPQINYAIFMMRPNSRPDMVRVDKILSGNDDQLSYYVNSRAVSQTYQFPFEDYNFIKTKRMIDKFNLEEQMYVFTRNNKIYWRHAIKYYVILFHDEYGRSCSYFESPEIKYNFGIKPFSEIWTDFWGEEDK